MSPRQARGERTVARYLDAALAAYGAGDHTVHAVVARAGGSLGSLYHHFGNFDGLAAALYSRCLGELLDALVAALDGVRGPRAGVRAVVTAYLGFVTAHPVAARYIHASAYASYLPAHAERIAADKAPRIAALTGWLAPHVAAGRVVDLPAPLIEMLLIGPVAEVSRRWLAGDSSADPATAARHLPDRIWQSLRGDVT